MVLRIQFKLRLGTFILASLFWIIPGHITVFGEYSEFPVDITSLLAMSIVWFICFAITWEQEIDRRRMFLIAVSFIIAAITVSSSSFTYSRQGLLAKYYNNSLFQGEPQYSWKTDSKTFTRIDPRIAFTSHGFSFAKQYFPLYFANNIRIERSMIENSDKKNYIFSVQWDGFLTIPPKNPGKSVKIWIESTGGEAALQVESHTVRGGEHIMLNPGIHTLQIRFSRSQPEPPSLYLKWEMNGYQEAVPASAFSNARIKPNTGTFYFVSIAGFVSWICALAFLFKSVAVKKFKTMNALLCLLFLSLLFNSALDLSHKGKNFDFQIMAQGQDWLDYETFSQDILSGDFLTRIESPFISMNFGYRYILALSHFLVGEDPALVTLFQQTMMGLFICVAAWLIAHFFCYQISFIFIVTFLLAHQPKFVSFYLLDTSWSMIFSSGFLVLLMSYLHKPTMVRCILSAIALGISILLRANFFPFIPVAATWIFWVNYKNNRHNAVLHALLLTLISLGIFSLIAWRNFAVGGEWRWFPDTGLLNLWIGNLPPEFKASNYFGPQWIPHKNEILYHIIKYIIHDPFAWLKHTMEKVLFIFGIDTRSGIQITAQVVIPWIIVIYGGFKLWFKNNVISRIDLGLLLMWIFIVNIPLIIIFPWGYGHRLSAPSYPAIYFIIALALSDNFLIKNVLSQYDKIKKAKLNF